MDNPSSMICKPREMQALVLKQDERGNSGIELRVINPRDRNKDKPWRVTLYNNNSGLFECGFELSHDEAELMRDWLNDLLTRFPTYNSVNVR